MPVARGGPEDHGFSGRGRIDVDRRARAFAHGREAPPCNRFSTPASGGPRSCAGCSCVPSGRRGRRGPPVLVVSPRRGRPSPSPVTTVRRGWKSRGRSGSTARLPSPRTRCGREVETPFSSSRPTFRTSKRPTCVLCCLRPVRDRAGRDSRPRRPRPTAAPSAARGGGAGRKRFAPGTSGVADRTG